MWPHSVSSMNTNVSEAPLRRLLNCLPLQAATKKATSTMGFHWFLNCLFRLSYLIPAISPDSLKILGQMLVRMNKLRLVGKNDQTISVIIFVIKMIITYSN